MKRASNVMAALSLASVTTAALASDFTGVSLEDALDELQARGLSILYSSDLVKPDMRVLATPRSYAPRALLEELVRPHGIRIVEGPAGLLLLTRAAIPDSASLSDVDRNVAEIVVTASRYEWERVPQTSLTRLSEAELRLAPNVGDDPLRTLARLPGAASSDLSAKLNVRGGGADETLLRFDGLRLLNPFHLKDFQSLFSAINPALIGAVDVYTGGFPARFGDRMSGVVDIHPIRAEGAGHREIAVSPYNASGLAAGRLERGRTDWAFAARRGNLERVLQWGGMDLGDPTYSDLYAHVGRRIGESIAVSANLLRFDDDIELADGDREERAHARYRDHYSWLRVDAHPRESLIGSAILARTDLESARTGAADQPGISRGTLADRREFTIASLQTDWSWRASQSAVLQFGGEWRRSAGRYLYRDAAEFDVLFEIANSASQRDRSHELDLRPRGDQYGAYVSLRAELNSRLSFESGVRWDRSTLPRDEEYISPRVSVLHRFSDSTLLRASWGRFVQTQGIDELSASDGIVAFDSAQRADHWVLSLQQHFDAGLELRVEGYHKRYSRLRPRFENLLNTLVVLPELKPDRVGIAPTRARSDGIELSLRSVRARPMFWWASYTWSRAEDSFADRSVRRSWDQQHAVSAGIGWDEEPWELTFAGVWHSGWPTAVLEPRITDERHVVHAEIANTRRLKSYLDIDARVARTFQLGSGSVTAFFEISNALNRRNECCTEYEIDDETAPPEFVVESIRSLPLLPSLGVIWKF